MDNMKCRWMYGVMVLLALAVTASSGCKRKDPKTATIGTELPGFASDQVIIGYDEYGQPIYADSSYAMGFRTDGAEFAQGQFEPVYFDFDSQQLNPAEMAKVETVALYLQQNPTHGIIVDGHCDERGSSEYNLGLGERRALAVRAALIARGIDGARIHTRTYGKEQPVAFGHDEASWRLNRRAEFIATQM